MYPTHVGMLAGQTYCSCPGEWCCPKENRHKSGAITPDPAAGATLIAASSVTGHSGEQQYGGVRTYWGTGVQDGVQQLGTSTAAFW